MWTDHYLYSMYSFMNFTSWSCILSPFSCNICSKLLSLEDERRDLFLPEVSRFFDLKRYLDGHGFGISHFGLPYFLFAGRPRQLVVFLLFRRSRRRRPHHVRTVQLFRLGL